MVSQHRDGEIATELLGAWGVTTVRGSATTRGAVRRLPAAGRRLPARQQPRRDSRRPARSALRRQARRRPSRQGGRQPRSIRSPMRPLASARLRSWDGLMIPLPFARLRIVVGEPLEVPAQASDEELDRCRAELERRLVDADRVGGSDGRGMSEPARRPTRSTGRRPAPRRSASPTSPTGATTPSADWRRCSPCRRCRGCCARGYDERPANASAVCRPRRCDCRATDLAALRLGRRDALRRAAGRAPARAAAAPAAGRLDDHGHRTRRGRALISAPMSRRCCRSTRCASSTASFAASGRAR